MNTQKQNEVSISRDPFARGNVVRQKASGECAWCGQPARFRYGWSADDKPRSSYQTRVFCSRSCERSFNT